MIQSPKELSAALQRLLVRAGDENPSRLKLAQELRVLATQLEPQVKTGASTKVPLAQTRKLIEQAYSVGQASHSSVIREDVQKYIRQVEGLIRIPGPPSGALVSAILDVFWAYGVLSKDEDADGNGYNAQSSSDGRREASSKAKTDGGISTLEALVDQLETTGRLLDQYNREERAYKLSTRDFEHFYEEVNRERWEAFKRRSTPEELSRLGQ